MDDRLLLDKIDSKNQSVEIEGKTYRMKTVFFPTLDKADHTPFLQRSGQS